MNKHLIFGKNIKFDLLIARRKKYNNRFKKNGCNTLITPFSQRQIIICLSFMLYLEGLCNCFFFAIYYLPEKIFVICNFLSLQFIFIIRTDLQSKQDLIITQQ